MKIYDGKVLNMKIDQGGDDPFLNTQLFPQRLVDESSARNNVNLEYRFLEDYDHSYWFIQTFVEDHIEFHSNHLLN